MLKGINNQDLQNKQQLAQSTGVDKAALMDSNNPYSKIDKNLLIDKLDISHDALKLYEKDLDIAKFTDLALSDPEDRSHNFLVASKMLSGEIEADDQDIFESLHSNKRFLNDLFD